MKIPCPEQINRAIATRAVQYARQDIIRRGWKSSGAIQPYYANGRVGIRTTVKHLIYQNRGFGPFVMWWVEGRKVPIADQSGTHVVYGKDPGKPGYVFIPGRGRVWRDQKWRHPGLKPKRFFETAISAAIRDSKADLQQMMINTLSGGDGS